MKLRPYGRLIGIDSSLMDRFLKDSKILRPHAILHDAVGYIQESTKKDRVTLTFYHVTLTALCKELFFEFDSFGNKNCFSKWRVNIETACYSTRCSRIHSGVYKKGPCYAYILPCDINSPFAGHITGIASCWYTKIFKSITLHLLEC